jgi:hypothetical protein
MTATSAGAGRRLTVTALADAKRLPADFLRGLGLADDRGAVAIPYYDPAGNEYAVKRRTALVAKEGSFWPAGVSLVAYGQERLYGAAKAGFLILVEGESDCWALWHHGLPALGLPGAGAAKTLMAEHLQDVQRIYVSREPDRGGDQFIPAVQARLSALRFGGNVYELRMPGSLKDPADLHVDDPARFKERFKEAILRSTPLGGTRQQSRPGPDKPARRKARTVEPYTPPPLDALPGPVALYVRQHAAALGCDPAYVVLPALSVVASAIGNSRVLRLKRGWEEPSVVWTAVISDSGTLKSPAWLKAVRPLFRLQKQLVGQHRAALKGYKSDLAEYREGGRTGEEPEEPVLRRVVCSDTTIEKLAEILEDNPRGTLLARDELAGWIGSFSRYKGKQGGSDLPNWLEMHRAGPLVIDRKTGERRFLLVERAAVSVTGGIQPGVAARTFTPEFLEAGLVARLLLTMPPKLPKRWSEVEVDTNVQEAFCDVLDRLLALKPDREDGEEVPHVLRLSAQAKDVWVPFYNEWAQEQAAAEGELAAALAKLEAYAARFTLLHHVVTFAGLKKDDRCEVGVESVEAGIRLCRWFAREMRRVYATLSESAEERDARRLVEFIHARGGRITSRALQRANSRKYPTATAAELALDALVRDGLASWQDRPQDTEGGRPTRDCVLAPDITDTTSTGEFTGAAAPDNTSDTTPFATANTHGSLGNGEVSSVVSGVGQDTPAARPEGGAGGDGFVGQGEVSSDADERDWPEDF